MQELDPEELIKKKVGSLDRCGRVENNRISLSELEFLEFYLECKKCITPNASVSVSVSASALECC